MTLPPLFCAKCNCELWAPGALIFSPPVEDGLVHKFHICMDCWRMLVPLLNLGGFSIGIRHA